MIGGYIATRHLSGDGCAHHCHKNFGGCSPTTCGIPSGHHWRRVASTPEPRRNTEPRPTTYEEWEDLEADRDRLAAELARVRSALSEIVAVRYGLDITATDEERGDYWARLCDQFRRIARAALAQTQDGTTEGKA